MGIIDKLNAIGIVDGGIADILLDSRKQLRIFENYGIKPAQDKFSDYRCVIVKNNGRRVYQSPILGYSESAALQGASLQVGIFTLIQFQHLVPLLPIANDKYPERVNINLYAIPEESFNLEKLAGVYNIRRVFDDFLKMPDKCKVSQHEFIKEFERKKSIVRKAAKMARDTTEAKQQNEPSMMLEEIEDDDVFNQITDTLKLQKQQYEQTQNLDPWSGSSDADSSEKTNIKLK